MKSSILSSSCDPIRYGNRCHHPFGRRDKVRCLDIRPTWKMFTRCIFETSRPIQAGIGILASWVGSKGRNDCRRIGRDVGRIVECQLWWARSCSLAVEKQIVGWMRELMGFPSSANGVFVTGSSIANFLAILVARNAATHFEVRETGIDPAGKWTVYASDRVHRCIGQALDMAGLGSHRCDACPSIARTAWISTLIGDDPTRSTAGKKPLCIVATAGSVDTGAIDPLEGLHRIAKQEGMWFHVDGAFGALGMMSSEIAPRLRGLERADSIAFDFHKWAQVPYDAGFVLFRDGELQRKSFHAEADYLQRSEVGMSAGSPWPCDLGPDLSRGFRALKTWMTLQAYGSEKLGRIMTQTCRWLRSWVSESKNITSWNCLHRSSSTLSAFDSSIRTCQLRTRCDQCEIVNLLHIGGLVAPSSTKIDGRSAIRAALFNHRTTTQDIDTLLHEVQRLGEKALYRLRPVRAA